MCLNTMLHHLFFSAFFVISFQSVYWYFDNLIFPCVGIFMDVFFGCCLFYFICLFFFVSSFRIHWKSNLHLRFNFFCFALTVCVCVCIGQTLLGEYLLATSCFFLLLKCTKSPTKVCFSKILTIKSNSINKFRPKLCYS